jgi:sugar-specific transcriptional regulator TrmB
MQLVEKLEKFGLSHKEAQVYVVLLELGSVPVQEIAKKSAINRSTTYVLLGSLAEHGLVSVSEKDGLKMYSPAPPERLIQLLEESVKKYTELVGVAHGLLPELKAMYAGVGTKPRVQFFEGLEGVKTAYEDTLTAQETIRAYASIKNMHTALPEYFPEYYQRRANKNIKIRAIFPDTPEARERLKHNKKEGREARLVSSEKYAFSPEINLYDDKVVFMSLVEKFSLIIESPELADALKKAFELSWAEASRLHIASQND